MHNQKSKQGLGRATFCCTLIQSIAARQLAADWDGRMVAGIRPRYRHKAIGSAQSQGKLCRMALVVAAAARPY